MADDKSRTSGRSANRDGEALQVLVPSTSEESRIRQLPVELLRMTLDQMRTLVLVHSHGLPSRVAQILERDQSSIQKQLDSVDRVFRNLTGQALFQKGRRGEHYQFASESAEALGWAKHTLLAGDDLIRRARQRSGKALTIGTTEFTLGYYAAVYGDLSAALGDVDLVPTLVHVRTREFWDALRGGKVDLLFGGFESGTDLDGLDFIELNRDGVCLLTNLPGDQLPDRPVTRARLRALPLVVPSGGLVRDLAAQTFDTDEHLRGFNIAAEIDDIYYGLALLRHNLIKGVMLTLTGVGEAVQRGDLPTSQSFRLLDLEPTLASRAEVVSGVLARRGERERVSADHPINIAWNVIQGRVSSLRGLALSPYGEGDL